MRFPPGVTAESFLDSCWQREVRELPAAIPDGLPELSPGELAWLATQDDVESRLIFTEHCDDRVTYRLESGPFDEETLASLPDRNWTLLVQDVEKHLPDFRQWLSLASFIPDWRVDDLMISFAAPGGSVGPHLDNYDVFLCQVSGRREWRIGDASQARPARDGGELSLLQPFDDAHPIVASAGDILYLPPGVPHWGVAQDNCMTFSLGMRAPCADELRCTFDRLYGGQENPFPSGMAAQNLFYTDADLSLREAKPGQISVAAIARCRALCDDNRTAGDAVLATVLGCTVSDLKPWLDPEPGTLADLASVSSDWCDVHGMARLAWYASNDEFRVFANGHYLECGIDQIEPLQNLCRDRRADVKMLLAPTNRTLATWLVECGAFDLPMADE